MSTLYRDGLEPNIGLLDARGTGQIFHTLGRKFFAIEFFDFCTIAEEIVLRDKIILPGIWESIRDDYKVSLKSFVSAGVFVPYRERFDLPNLPKSNNPNICATAFHPNANLTHASTEDANFEIRRSLGAEAQTGYPATPLLRQLQHFGLLQRPQLEHSICDLATQVRDVSNMARETRNRFQKLAHIPTISIPPIALQALSRARHFDQVCYEILQLRDEYAPLRKSMSELEEQIMRKNIPPSKMLDIENSWIQKWQKVTQDLGGHQLSLSKTAQPLLLNGGKLIGAYATTDIITAIEAGLQTIGDVMTMCSSRQLRPVHRSVRNYMNTTDQEMKSAVAQVFEYDFVRLDCDIASLTNPSSPWMLAIGNNIR